jgi:hypothetical protein
MVGKPSRLAVGRKTDSGSGGGPEGQRSTAVSDAEGVVVETPDPGWTLEPLPRVSCALVRCGQSTTAEIKKYLTRK